MMRCGNLRFALRRFFDSTLGLADSRLRTHHWRANESSLFFALIAIIGVLGPTLVLKAQNEAPNCNAYAKIWDQRKKGFLLINVSSSPGAMSDLKFATVNGQLVAEALKQHEYTQLASLNGDNATREKIYQALENAANEMALYQDDGILLVYYSGHGTPRGRADFRLATADEDPGPRAGISVADLLRIIRENDEESQPQSRYDGDLIVVVDACFSGAIGDILGLEHRFLRKTVVLTSSDQGESFSIKRKGVELSAFTSILIDVLQTKPSWQAAEDDKNGMLNGTELAGYATVELDNIFKESKSKIEGIPATMRPQTFGDGTLLVAFDESSCERCNIACQLNQISYKLTLSLNDAKGRFAIGGRYLFYEPKEVVQQRQDRMQHLQLLHNDILIKTLTVDQHIVNTPKEIELEGVISLPLSALMGELELRVLGRTGKTIGKASFPGPVGSAQLARMSASVAVKIDKSISPQLHF